jgi:hypothetical protein
MLNIKLFQAKPLTDRGDYAQLQGQLEDGMPGMAVTVLVAYEPHTLKPVGYGAALADSNFSIILAALATGPHDIKVCPVGRDGITNYQYASEILRVVVHDYPSGQVFIPPSYAP